MATSSAEMEFFREQLEAATLAARAAEKAGGPSVAEILKAAVADDEGDEAAVAAAAKSEGAANGGSASSAADLPKATEVSTAERRELRLKLLDKTDFAGGDAPSKPSNGDAVSSNAGRRVAWMLGMVRSDVGVRARLEARVAEQRAAHAAELSSAGLYAVQHNMSTESLHSRRLEAIRAAATARVSEFVRARDIALYAVA
jgi:hypothetical protein